VQMPGWFIESEKWISLQCSVNSLLQIVFNSNIWQKSPHLIQRK
jgi:hypothetical protein